MAFISLNYEWNLFFFFCSKCDWRPVCDGKNLSPGNPAEGAVDLLLLRSQPWIFLFFFFPILFFPVTLLDPMYFFPMKSHFFQATCQIFFRRHVLFLENNWKFQGTCFPILKESSLHLWKAEVMIHNTGVLEVCFPKADLFQLLLFEACLKYNTQTYFKICFLQSFRNNAEQMHFCKADEI